MKKTGPRAWNRPCPWAWGCSAAECEPPRLARSRSTAYKSRKHKTCDPTARQPHIVWHAGAC
eukprot:3819724-Prymnesium_polylepis.1